MSKHFFTVQHETGSIRVTQKNGETVHEPCIANIGTVSGQNRQIPAILCDGATDQDQWHILNMTNQQGLFAGQVAICGAVSEQQQIDLTQRYMSSFFDNAVIGTSHALTNGGMGRFLDSAANETKTAFLLKEDAENFNFRLTQAPVQWDDEDRLLSHNGYSSTMLFDMVQHDDNAELLEKCTPSDIMAKILDGSEGMLADAMVLEYKQFDKVIKKLGDALKKQGDQEFFVENVTPIAPFKKNGVVNVGVIFEMNDTQTVTVLFNNPDTTPAKLTQADILTSWKWMLNKRDVTAALQPKASDSTRYTAIAKRMMLLLVKNHARFQRAAAEKLRIANENAELTALLESKQAELNDMDQQIAQVQADIDAKFAEKQNKNAVSTGAENQDQDATQDITLYRIKSTNPRARKPVGQVKLTALGNGSYNVFAHEGTVGGEYSGSIKDIQSWLTARHTPMGEAMSGTGGWDYVKKRLVLESGEDVLNVISTAEEPIPDNISVEVPEGFTLTTMAAGHWALNHESLPQSVAVKILEIDGKYQGHFQIASSTKTDRLETAVQWSVNILNEFMQSMAAENQEEQNLIDNWEDQIPENFDKEKFKKGFDVVKAEADKKGLAWNTADVFKFVSSSILRFMGADQELNEFVQLTSILTNNANTMSRKLYAIHTNGAVVLGNKSAKDVQKRMEDYAQEIFTPEQQKQFTEETKQKQIAEVAAKKAAAIEDIKIEIADIWQDLKSSQAVILKWMTDGYRPHPQKIGAITRQVFSKGNEAYKPQNHKAY